MNRLLLFAVIILGMSACKKENLPGDTTKGNLSFYFDGEIGGDQVVFAAGQKGVYMNTSYRQSGAYVELNGTFSQEDTLIIDSFLSISFYAESSVGAAPGVFFAQNNFSNFSTYTDHYFDVTYNPYEISLSPKMDSFRLEFGDSTSYGDSLLDTFTHRYSSAGVYNLFYQVYYGGGKYEYLNTDLKLVDGKTCYPQLKLAPNSGGTTYYFEIIPATVSSFIVNNKTTGSSFTTTSFIGDSSNLAQAENNLELIVQDVACQTTFDMKMFFSNQRISPLFTYSVVEHNLMDDRLNSVVIDYIKNGKHYSSDAVTKRKILEVLDDGEYITNKYGQKTWSIKARMDGYLYNTANPQDSLYIKSDKLIFAVAVPN